MADTTKTEDLPISQIDFFEMPPSVVADIKMLDEWDQETLDKALRFTAENLAKFPDLTGVVMGHILTKRLPRDATTVGVLESLLGSALIRMVKGENR